MPDRPSRPPAFHTLAIHGGQSPEAVTGAIMPPVFQTSTYVQPELGRHTGYEYARVQNPTREALERNIAALEGGRAGLAFASGMAATETLLMTVCRAGDHVICEENVYGGTIRYLTQVLARFGVEVSFVDTRRAGNVADALTDRTRIVFLETPSNPLMRLADLHRIATLCREAGVLTAVDNTFATPFNQQPLAFGIDVVLHSATKYLNGHSDVIAGLLVTKDEELAESIAFVRKSAGGILGPWDSWLVLRGMKTLALRMERHNANGLAVARFLDGHPRVRAVHYPGLEAHPQHDLARKQMTGFSGMVSLDTGSPERAKTLLEGTRLFQLAESLGGVESLISLPARMTHASVPAERREAMGVTESLVRLSVGIEDIDDLLADLDGALRKE